MPKKLHKKFRKTKELLCKFIIIHARHKWHPCTHVIYKIEATVNQHPPMHHQGWMICEIRKQFSVGFQFPS